MSETPIPGPFSAIATASRIKVESPDGESVYLVNMRDTYLRKTDQQRVVYFEGVDNKARPVILEAREHVIEISIADMYIDTRDANYWWSAAGVLKIQTPEKQTITVTYKPQQPVSRWCTAGQILVLILIVIALFLTLPGCGSPTASPNPKIRTIAIQSYDDTAAPPDSIVMACMQDVQKIELHVHGIDLVADGKYILRKTFNGDFETYPPLPTGFSGKNAAGEYARLQVYPGGVNVELGEPAHTMEHISISDLPIPLPSAGTLVLQQDNVTIALEY